MDFIDTLVIFWIVLTLFVAFCFVKYISGKAATSLTIVNLIHKDVIIYINLFWVAYVNS
jgi:hypothetical protein